MAESVCTCVRIAGDGERGEGGEREREKIPLRAAQNTPTPLDYLRACRGISTHN